MRFPATACHLRLSLVDSFRLGRKSRTTRWKQATLGLIRIRNALLNYNTNEIETLSPTEPVHANKARSGGRLETARVWPPVGLSGQISLELYRAGRTVTWLVSRLGR
jgi:hypothetical protein